jgi:hypothetical protein
VRHRVGIPWRAACRVRGERERVFRDLDAEGLGLGAASLESFAEQLAGQQVEGQDAALAVFGCLLDPASLLDDVVGGDPDLLSSEVEPVLPQRADFAAAGSGRDRDPQVQAELLVLGPDEIEQPGGQLGGGRVRLALTGMRRPGVLRDVALGPLVADGQVQRRGDDRVDPQDRRGLHRPARVRPAPGVANVQPGGPVVT